MFASPTPRGTPLYPVAKTRVWNERLWDFCRFSVSNSWTMFEETCDFMLYCVFMVDLGLEFGVLSSEEEAIGADCDRLA